MTNQEFITDLLKRYKKTFDKDTKLKLKRCATRIDELEQYKSMLAETEDLDDTIFDLNDIGLN